MKNKEIVNKIIDCKKKELCRLLKKKYDIEERISELNFDISYYEVTQ